MISSNQVFTKNNKLIVGALPSTTYNVMDIDDIINVDTSAGKVDIYLPNIKNSSILSSNRVIYINDVGGSASLNNISIHTTGGDLVNSLSVLNVSENGANVILQASNNSEWLANGVTIALYKVYTALLTQKKNNPPTAIVLENTIGDIVWTYNSKGVYRGTLNGAFLDANKFFTLNYKSMIDAQTFVGVKWENTNSFSVSTTKNGFPEDSILDNNSIEIRVYN